MKKISLFLALVTACVAVNAQSSKSTSFKPFKVDFATGYAIPGGSGAKGGVLFSIEPKYAVMDNLSIGLRMEAAVMARASVDQSGQTISGDVKASASYVLTGDYYFSNNKFRPFGGVGAGLFKTAAAKFDSNTNTSSVDASASSKFGFLPRVGFEFGHFRMAVEYNVVGKTGDINNNYMGIKLGFFAGGGRK